MMEALLRDDRLLVDLAQLASNLDLLLPGGLGERVPFSGDEPLGLDGALAQIDRLAAMDRLEDSLSRRRGSRRSRRIDRDEVRDLLGDDAVRDLDALDDLARRLEAAGYLTRDGERLELTPRGSRRDRPEGPRRPVRAAPARRVRRSPDRPGRSWRRARGDHQAVRVRGPVPSRPARHADQRAGPRGERARAAGGPAGIHLTPADFEVYRTEQLTRTATVLLVDMSRSMLLRGCFLAAKKVAVALDTLIRTQYPHDHLTVIGFAYYAREIRPGALAELTWHGYEYGTNLQHGLLLARRILARQAAANKEIVVITDGEPTAHFEGGQVEFSYPPTRRTISETLHEVQRCTKEGITINTFMLERSRALAEFVAHMTRLNRGRAFYATPEHLGEYVLVDFVGRRTKRVS